MWSNVFFSNVLHKYKNDLKNVVQYKKISKVCVLSISKFQYMVNLYKYILSKKNIKKMSKFCQLTKNKIKYFVRMKTNDRDEN
jgi:hypothetical protein